MFRHYPESTSIPAAGRLANIHRFRKFRITRRLHRQPARQSFEVITKCIRVLRDRAVYPHACVRACLAACENQRMILGWNSSPQFRHLIARPEVRFGRHHYMIGSARKVHRLHPREVAARAWGIPAAFEAREKQGTAIQTLTPSSISRDLYDSRNNRTFRPFCGASCMSQVLRDSPGNRTFRPLCGASCMSQVLRDSQSNRSLRRPGRVAQGLLLSEEAKRFVNRSGQSQAVVSGYIHWQSLPAARLRLGARVPAALHASEVR